MHQSHTTDRDLRVDFFRGLALMCIFIDHIPGNVAAQLTLTNFGFADAAEVFVMLAGYACFLAYWPSRRASWRDGLVKVASRIRDIYLAHIIVLLVAVLGLVAAAHWFGNPLFIEHVNLDPLLHDPLGAMARALVLFYQPGYLNILPLYVVLLMWLPILLWLMRIGVAVALLVSGAIWLAAGVLRYNLPAWTGASGWEFDPFAWQFLFTLGTIAAGGSAPRIESPLWRRGLLYLAMGYVAFAFVVAAPWTKIPWLEHAWLLPDFRPTISKQYLSAWRVAHIMALAYIVAITIPTHAAWLNSRGARWLIDCGQNSLPVFCVSIILSLVGFVVLTQSGAGWPAQVAVSVVGVGCLGLLGFQLAQSRRPVPEPACIATVR